MSAKLLNVYVEENTDLEKQIGCMTGMFQMFDRHRFLMGRRLNGDNHKRIPSSGRSLSTGGNQREECSPSSPQINLEYNPRKSLNEHRRSSLSSSLSFPSPLERTKTRKSRSSDVDAKSIHSDFRGIVKDSINGETKCLSVKTSSKEEVKKDRRKLKHRDSPRPILPQDLNASLQVMGRFKESPAPPSLSEIPRFSCDGREITRTKSTKLKELPRLSLDSRDTLRDSNFDPKLKELDMSPNQRVPSVVAKLMGLEAMPNSAPQETNKASNFNFFHGNSEKNHILRNARNSFEASDMPNSKHCRETESVYSQIERRVKELDFQESNKDLRALKHVLDTMQAKGLLIETKKGNDLNLTSPNAPTPHITTPRAIGSPIVIMKSSKSINRVEELQGLSGLRKLRTSGLSSRKQVKDSSTEKRTENITPERSASQVKTLSPRVQQRKIEVEKKPKPPIRKQSVSKQQVVDSISPRIKNKVKLNQAQKNREEHKKLDGVARTENCSMKLDSIQFQQGKQKSLWMVNEEVVSTMEPTVVVTPEQPSPISVLDASFYHDQELSPSPVKRISSQLQENRMISMSQFTTSPSGSEMDSSKLGNIKNLVQKLSQMSATGDTENQEPNYMSEILTASGLQPEALSSKTAQEKIMTTSSTEKLHHKLILDMVQGILVQKLESLSHGPQSDLFVRARKFGRQFSLRESFSEIKSLLAERPRGNEEAMSGKDLLPQSEEWEDFGVEVPGMVLEIERLIFKDLVDDIVSGEADTSLLGKATQRRRQLFN